tara:strand:- start:526 stop:1560 length:1035 start_codon:yes stop_codon:yes gene_type:complete
MIRVGLNGFGRIGRAITRIISDRRDMKLVAINDIDDDIENLSYLIKYDSTYGSFKKKISTFKNSLFINKNKINFYSKKNIINVPWKKNKVDILIEATGLSNNIKQTKNLIKNVVKKVLVTNSPNENIDFYMVIGANEKNYDPKKHHVISTSICDASALSPILKLINDKYSIENGFITTLHSILSYQNLLDGSLKSVSNPSHSWKDYSLGRNSNISLIPKNTTAVKAVERVIPEIKGKLHGLSFRVPTNIVCGSDISIKVSSNCNKAKLLNELNLVTKKYPKIYEIQSEKLVSIDHVGTSKSLIIDQNFIEVINSKFIKLVLWYDNEWGYSTRVLDIAKIIHRKN